MKKILCVIAALLFLLTMTACGNETQDENNNSSTDGNQTQTSQVDESGNAESNDDSEVVLSYSYKVPGKNIVIDVPNYQEIEQGYTQLYILHGIKYVAVTAAKKSTATELSAAHADAFAKFKENIQNYSYVNDLTVVSDSVESINGIEMYKYEGTLNCALDYSNKDYSYDAYVIGYSFIMDGVPCTVTGSVIDQEQPEDMIAEMKATVEAMIQTLRSER